MSPINGSSPFGFDPSQLQQKMEQQFHSADVDQNGSLTKAEAQDAMSELGMDSSKFDSMFNKMDSNGNGEISLEEQQDLLQAMEERRQSLFQQGGATYGAGSSSDSTFESLLESLSASDDESEEKSESDELLERLRSNERSQEDINATLEYLNQVAPPINTYA